MGPVPKIKNGYKYIFNLNDHASKLACSFPAKTLEAKECAKLIFQWICRYGIPECILTDQGRNYESELTAELMEMLDINKLRCTSYHAMGNGLNERYNRTLQEMLKPMVNEHQNDWDEYLEATNFAYNTAVHATTKCTPYELVFGMKPKVPLDLLAESPKLELFFNPESYAETIQEELRRAYKRVSEARDLKMDKAKLRYDRKVRAASFNVNDKVWLLDTAMKKGVCKKLSKKYKGPYNVITRLEDCNYTLKPLTSKGRKITVHQNRLKKCFDRKIIYNTIKQSEKDTSNEVQEHSLRKEVQVAKRIELDGEPIAKNITTCIEESSLVNKEDPLTREHSIMKETKSRDEKKKENEEDQSFKVSKYLSNKMQHDEYQHVRPQRTRKRPDFLQYN